MIIFACVKGKELEMAILDLRLKEQELIQEINSDATLLEAALKYVRELKRSGMQAPCRYSVEELRDRLKESRIAAKNGAYKTQAEMRSKHTL